MVKNKECQMGGKGEKRGEGVDLADTRKLNAFRLKLGEGVKLNIILKERSMNFSHLSKGGSPCLEKEKE